MTTTLIEIRRAKTSDATAVAATHDEAWRAAYQGIIPGNELDKLINRRGPDWWDSAIRKGSRITFCNSAIRSPATPITGATARTACSMTAKSTSFICVRNSRGLVSAAACSPRRARICMQSGLKRLVVWALSDNEPAVEFYRALGGRAVARSSEKFGTKTLDKVAYAWQA